MLRSGWADHSLNFVSVILGVSLAFFVNDCSNKQKTRREMDFILVSLLNEIREDIETYETYQVPDNQEKVDQLYKILAILSSQANADSLSYYFETSLHVNSYSPQNLTFSSIISSGKLEYIDNYDLRSALLLYQMNSKEVEMQGKIQYEFFMDQLVPWLIDHPEVVEKESLLLGNQGFITLLSIYASLVEGKLEKYKSILKDAKAIENKLLKVVDVNSAASKPDGND